MYKECKTLLKKYWKKNKICTIYYIFCFLAMLWLIIPVFCLEYLAVFGDKDEMFKNG